MADTAVAITAGSGTNIDTRTEATNGNHRQVVVLGDPATNAGVAPVDATNGLAVQIIPALPAGTNAIGKLAANSGVDIGDVDVTSVPTDPFGANADAASATGSISAKLRAIATALGVTAFDLGTGTGGSRTLRFFKDTAQWIGGAGAVTSAVQRVTLPSDDPAVAALGTTAGAAVTTNATGTIQQYLRGLVTLFTTATFKAASTAPVAADPALVVAISPNSVNANGGASAANSAPVVPADQYGAYETVAASQTAQALGATGATGDYLAYVEVFPGTAGCGVVTILDNASTWGTFAGGGTTALPSLVPFRIDVGAYSTSGAWKITTGANVTAVGVGKFT